MIEYETMTYERKGRIAYIMFNRPHVLNAANHQFEDDLREALLEFDTDDAAWVGIIHGAGRAFCAGADIKQRFVELTPPGARPPRPGAESRGLPGAHRQLEAHDRRRSRLRPGHGNRHCLGMRHDSCVGGGQVRHHGNQAGPGRWQDLGPR